MHVIFEILGVIFFIILLFVAWSFLSATREEVESSLYFECLLDEIKKVNDQSKRQLIASDYGVAYVFGDYIKLDKIKTRLTQIIEEQGELK